MGVQRRRVEGLPAGQFLDSLLDFILGFLFSSFWLCIWLFLAFCLARFLLLLLTVSEMLASTSEGFVVFSPDEEGAFSDSAVGIESKLPRTLGSTILPAPRISPLDFDKGVVLRSDPGTCCFPITSLPAPPIPPTTTTGVADLL